MGANPRDPKPDNWGTLAWVALVVLVLACLVWPYL